MNKDHSISQQAIDLASAGEHEIISFLRRLISIPSPSCGEGKVVEEIRRQMELSGFDEVWIDAIGNVIGRMGKGKHIVLYDSHVDTVGLGDPAAWDFDPYAGKVEEGILFGRGASDNKAATATQVYGGEILKRIGIPEDITLYVIGTVQEEDCDGLALEYALKNSLPRLPDFVVLGECTDLDIYRGHRGRMEIQIQTRGVACHASAPERGVNAIYKMLPIIQGIEQLNRRLKEDPFLGKGSAAVTRIDCQTPSINAVPDNCTIYIDRRLTHGETLESALEEIGSLEGIQEAEVRLPEYMQKSHTGLTVSQPAYFPTWVLDEKHPLVKAGVSAAHAVRGESPGISRWVFSTNGVASMGKLGIPTIGFGPSSEKYAHTTQDQVPIRHLTIAAAFYALFPHFLSEVLRAGI